MTLQQRSSANARVGGPMRGRLRRFLPVAVIVLAMVAVFATGAHRHVSLETLVRHRMAIICTRRPRSADERPPWMLHLMTVRGRTIGEASFETDRMKVARASIGSVATFA